MKKKSLAAIFPEESTTPQASRIVLNVLLATSVFAHALKDSEPHIESEPAPSPMQGGRATAWLTSTSTAAPNVTFSMPWLK